MDVDLSCIIFISITLFICKLPPSFKSMLFNQNKIRSTLKTTNSNNGHHIIFSLEACMLFVQTQYSKPQNLLFEGFLKTYLIKQYKYINERMCKTSKVVRANSAGSQICLQYINISVKLIFLFISPHCIQDTTSIQLLSTIYWFLRILSSYSALLFIFYSYCAFSADVKSR